MSATSLIAPHHALVALIAVSAESRVVAEFIAGEQVAGPISPLNGEG